MTKNWSKHHICPTSRGGQNVSGNVVRLTNNVHIAIHQVFANQLPHEQFSRLVGINESALTADFRKRVEELVNSDLEYVYEK